MKKSDFVYRAAMYLRVSQDDMDNSHSLVSGLNTRQESNSITNQREIISSFIQRQEDITLYNEYTDDGYSGSSFQRPGFERMMADADEGRINCIVVKDLSRFGRDYIEMGRYIQRIFPAKGIRFIAVTDCFDSLTADTCESFVILPVKNFINEAYCQDISRKVRYSNEARCKRGEYIGSFAPYGYKKDEENKNKLIVDDFAAGVVRAVFSWKIEGFSDTAIAKKLTALSIPSPMEHKRTLGVPYKTGFAAAGSHKWQSASIKRLLTNEVYLGHLVQGKRGKVNYKVNMVIDKPRCQWIRAENTHTAIIKREDFLSVQKLLRTDTRTVSDKPNFFAGLLFCGDCKEQMIRRKISQKETHKRFYICSSYNRGEGCTRRSILEGELKTAVSCVCKAYANAYVDWSLILIPRFNREPGALIPARLKPGIKHIKEEADKYARLSFCLYRDLKEGIITKEDYNYLHSNFTRRIKELREAAENYKILIQLVKRRSLDAAARLKRLGSLKELEELDRHTLVSLINHIYVYDGKRVEIEFNFRNVPVFLSDIMEEHNSR